MTQKFRENGELVSATLCQAEPAFVVDQRTKDKDGYWAVQLASGKRKKRTNPILGQMKKAKIDFTPEIIREFKVSKGEDLVEIGEKLTVDQVVSPGDLVDVSGLTKGRGFSGVIKRWGFKGQPHTHGHTKSRAPGSIGPQTPGRVIKGKKMPGHFGHQKKTVKNLEVLDVDSKTKRLLLKGSAPGHRGSWLVISVRGKSKEFIPLAKEDDQKGS